MTYTFTEIAENARTIEPSQTLGAINYCRQIAELADAVERLEYNLALQLSRRWEFPSVSSASADIRTQQWLDHLRAERGPITVETRDFTKIRERIHGLGDRDTTADGCRCPRCGTPTDTPQEALMHCAD